MQKVFCLIHICISLLFTISVLAQESDSLYIQKTQNSLVLDGVIDEAFWFQQAPSKNFYQYFPDNGKTATLQSEMYFSYDEDNFLVAVKCYSKSNDYVVPSLKRDYQAGGSDSFTWMFDTFNDGSNALFFGVNPEGVLREGTIANGGSEGSDFSTAWDNKWKGKTHRGDKYWSAELVIPFSTLRFKSDSRTWRVGAYRFDSQTNEISTIIEVPNNQGITNLAFMKYMVWEEPIAKNNKSISLIPYTSGGIIRDYEDVDQTKSVLQSKIGGDAKIGVTTGLNLDLTINPDFSQVEVDRQVTDLDRFEIFLPERRQFFVENADLFNSFGDRRINPFFSRRIGISTDTLSGDRIENPIMAGARLTGKINNNWRVGLINMQTQKDRQNDLPSFNYTIAAVQRKVFARSSVGFIFVNRDNFTDFDSETYDPYNRVMGIDYNLATKDNTWNGKTFYHRSFTPDKNANKQFAHGLELNYTNDLIQIGWEHQYVGEGYNAQIGFVPRTNFFRISPNLEFNFQLNNGIINQHGPGMDYDLLTDPDLNKTDESIGGFYFFSFTNNSRLSVSATRTFTLLTDDFEILADQPLLLAGTEFNYTQYRIRFRSDRRKPLSYSINPTFGNFFNANLVALNANVQYRFQPYGSISIEANFNRLILEAPFKTTNLILIGPRLDITFSKKLFLTTFLQYNNQIENFNINARFQWRFAPVSDFFIVYTDNYNTDGFINRNKALIAKFSYWFNL